MPVGRALVVPALMVLLTTAGACEASRSHQQDSGGEDVLAEGPLRVSLTKGGNSLLAPESHNWWATFGGLLLCSSVDEPLIIDDIAYEYQHKPLETLTLLRFVPDATRRPETAHGTWAPIISAQGRPGRLGGEEALGNIEADIDGTTVNAKCGEATSPDDGFTEVLTVIRVDESGGWISSLRVHYRSGEQEYSLPVDWQYVACGGSSIESRAC